MGTHTESHDTATVPNLLAGMGGDDEIAGGGGAGTLWGGRGADTLHGGPGLNRLIGGPGVGRFVFDEESGDSVITDFAGDRIDLTAFGFTRSEFEQYVTIDEERFLIGTRAGVASRVEVGVELDLAALRGVAGQEVLDSESLRFELGAGAHRLGSPMLRYEQRSVRQTTEGWRPGRRDPTAADSGCDDVEG